MKAHEFVSLLNIRSELEKKGTDSETSVSYWDIFLEKDDYGNLKTKLYDKRDDFNFSIVSLPYLCSNIPSLPILWCICLSILFVM